MVIKIDRLGEVRNNTLGTTMKIIRYNSYDDIDVEFLDEHHYIQTHQTYANFKKGSIKNPYDKSLFGVGYLGVGEHKIKENGKTTDAYEKWVGIIERCYMKSDKYPSYYGICTVCEEWLCFQNFAEWYEENKYKVDGRLHIDKDILFPNCNIYSSTTCLLVPQRINMLFTNKSNDRGLPNGIKWVWNGYVAQYNGKHLGVYPTIEEAYQSYADKKEEAIKKVADEYREVIPEKVYKALYNYKVDINNDKNYKP